MGVAPGAVIVQADYLDADEESLESVSVDIRIGEALSFVDCTVSGLLGFVGVGITDSSGNLCETLNLSGRVQFLDLSSSSNSHHAFDFFLHGVKEIVGNVNLGSLRVTGDPEIVFRDLVRISGDLTILLDQIGILNFSALEYVEGELKLLSVNNSGDLRFPVLKRIGSLSSSTSSFDVLDFPALLRVEDDILVYEMDDLATFNAGLLEYVGGGVVFGENRGSTSLEAILLPSLEEIHGFILGSDIYFYDEQRGYLDVGLGFKDFPLDAALSSVNLSSLEFVEAPVAFDLAAQSATSGVVLELPANVDIDGENGCVAYRQSLASGGSRGTDGNIVCLD